MIVEPPKPSASRIPMPPSLSVRAAVLGMLALVIFGVLFFRLWYLQILSGNQYVQQANANRLRELPIPAPRGEILDREGRVLVSNRVANAVQVVPNALPAARPARAELFTALGRVLSMSPGRIAQLVAHGERELPYAPVTIRTDAGPAALTVLSERQSEFPGVQQVPLSLRSYPHGDLAAQVLGYVSEVSRKELKLKGFRGVTQGTVVGQGGLEYYYDNWLRGRPGEQRVEVNAAGEPVAGNIPPTPPRDGYNLKTTLSLPLEEAGEHALREGIESARASGKPATGGAYVAMDPLTGEILATGSYPSFNPEAFTHPMTTSEYDALTGANTSGPRPLTNLAT
ncbi:MAG: penicillin-binding protein 2, partial [Solirubrobacteraceae bacterium]